jgi:O-antigen ligase
MDGLIWTASVWLLLFAAIYVMSRRRGNMPELFRRDTLALVLALLATHSTAAPTEAAEVLADPVVLERAVRGALAGLALALALPVLIRNVTRGDRGHRGLTSLGIYLFVALASVLFSAAPLVTFAKVFELSAGLAAVASIALGPEARSRIRRTLGVVIALDAALLITALLGFFLIPDTFSALQSRPGFFTDLTLTSPFAHNNGLSATGALLAAFALAKALENPKEKATRWWVLFVLGTAGTVLASGRQGVAIWVASVAILTFIHRRSLFFLLLAPAAAAMVAWYGADIMEVLSRDRPQNFTNLTGRLTFWETAIDVWRDHPWTGYGFGAGGRFVALESIGRSGITSLHSGYIEALVGVGLFGVIPLAYALFRTMAWSARKLLARSETTIAILIVPLILRTFVSMGFGGWLNAEFVLFALLVAGADVTWVGRRREAQRSEWEPTLTRAPSAG